MHFCVRGTGRRLSEELLWDTQLTDKPSRRRFIISASSWFVKSMVPAWRSTLSLSLKSTHSLYLFSHFSLCCSTTWEYLRGCVCVCVMMIQSHSQTGLGMKLLTSVTSLVAKLLVSG